MFVINSVSYFYRKCDPSCNLFSLEAFNTNFNLTLIINLSNKLPEFFFILTLQITHVYQMLISFDPQTLLVYQVSHKLGNSTL